jgi:hypothetical protein
MLVEATQSLLIPGSMKQLLKDFVRHGLNSTGLMPVVRNLFAARAAIVMFHEIQKEFRSELATGTSISLWALTQLAAARRMGNSQSWGMPWVSVKERPIASLCGAHFRWRYETMFRWRFQSLSVNCALMYVPTGSPTRTLQAWWLGLRELIRSRDDVTVDATLRDAAHFNHFALPRIIVDSEIAFQARMNGLMRAFHMLLGDRHATWCKGAFPSSSWPERPAVATLSMEPGPVPHDDVTGLLGTHCCGHGWQRVPSS